MEISKVKNTKEMKIKLVEEGTKYLVSYDAGNVCYDPRYEEVADVAKEVSDFATRIRKSPDYFALTLRVEREAEAKMGKRWRSLLENLALSASATDK
jgi:hypothetical protein